MSCIGEGQFAKVYKGTIKTKLFAVRKLKLTQSVISNRRFMRIAHILMQMKHRNIVSTFTYVLSEKIFVQELCGKEVYDMGEKIIIYTLDGAMKILENDFFLRYKILAVNNVCAALQYLHSERIIAGDVKPANILVCGEGDEWIFKLSDINIESHVKKTMTNRSITASSDIFQEAMYTLSYVAPELLSQNMFVSCNMREPSSDIYSVAILLYECLFPESPIQCGFNPIQHLEALRHNWRPEIPDTDYKSVNLLVNLIRRCWDKNPINRPSASGIVKETKCLFNSEVCMIIIILFAIFASERSYLVSY